MAAPARQPTLPATGSIPAAAYIRVSTTKQGDGYSPEIQEEQIRAFAAREGYDLMLLERDEESGHSLTRAGYAKVLEAARNGTIGAVLVHAFDRFARDGGEFATRCRELERLGCAFVSVAEGVERPGIMRFIRAGLNEQYSRDLARRVRPAMEASVKRGTHHGLPPFGFVLKYHVRVGGSGRYQAGTLVPDPATAWFVAELFRRYAAGGSLRTLAHWANSNASHPKSARGKPWGTVTLRYLLTNPTYCGKLRYNVERRSDRFETSAPGSEFTIPGPHEPIIDVETFDRVQSRLVESAKLGTRSKLQRPDPLAAGLLRCASCGGRMVISRRAGEDATHGSYACLSHISGTTVCRGMYRAALAHAALLSQVKRLRFLGWDLSRATLPVESTPNPRPALERRLQEAQGALRKHVGRLAMLDDLSSVELAAFRDVSRELSDAVIAIEQQLAALPASPPSVLDAKQLHEECSKLNLSELIDGLVAEDLEAELREVLLRLVQSATIVQRLPAIRSTWLRAEVVWTPAVQALLTSGQIELLPDAPVPSYPSTPGEVHAAAMKRYRARKRAGLVGVVPPARSGLKG
jgi:site-specific DNA recombinase